MSEKGGLRMLWQYSDGIRVREPILRRVSRAFWGCVGIGKSAVGRDTWQKIEPSSSRQTTQFDLSLRALSISQCQRFFLGTKIDDPPKKH